MGAATALLHGDRDMSIAALVLDSTFADLTQLAEEMVERGREAVGVFLTRALFLVCVAACFVFFRPFVATRSPWFIFPISSPLFALRSVLKGHKKFFRHKNKSARPVKFYV